MTELWKMTHQSGENIYDLSISWDEESFVDGNPAIQVSASVRRGANEEPSSIDATVAITNGNYGPEISVMVGDQGPFAMPMAELFDEAQLLELIPSFVYGGEPITGCLIRAGLVAVVGQVIRCKNTTQGSEWYLDRIRAMGHCLKMNIGRMGSRATISALKCILTGGF